MPSWWDPYIVAWNAHDADTLASFMAADAVYEDLALGERLAGRDAIRAWAAGIVDRLSSDFAFDTHTFFDAGDRYAAEWTMRGTHDRSGPRLAATGKPFAVRGVSVGRTVNGLIAENRDYWSLATLLVQVGAMPGPPPE